MKDLKITITREGNYYRMAFSCKYSEESSNAVVSHFGCLQINGDVISSGLLTTDAFKLMESQMYLLGKAI